MMNTGHAYRCCLSQLPFSKVNSINVIHIKPLKITFIYREGIQHANDMNKSNY